MSEMPRREFLKSSLVASSALWLPTIGSVGYGAPAPGIERRVPALATAEERLRQPDIWVMEVVLRPLRQIRVNLPDPKTGATTERLVWYLCYRAINRLITVKTSPNELPPSDKALAARTQVFVPEFTLVTDDNGEQKRYIDRVMPAAQPIINKRERGEYKNSIEIVGPLPPAVPEGQPGTEILGVATWRGVDPTADRFRIFMTGFSNGYEVTKGPNGEEIVLRKTLVQEYWRPGDELQQDEREIRAEGDPKWIYR